jgi:hypothetical protein
MAQALNQMSVERTSGGRKVLGKSPGLNGEVCDRGGAEGGRKTHFGLAYDPGKRKQREGKQRPQIELPPRSNFLDGALQVALDPNIPFKLGQLPALEVAHYCVVIARLRRQRQRARRVEMEKLGTLEIASQIARIRTAHIPQVNRPETERKNEAVGA